MIRIVSNEKRYDQIFIRYLGKDYPIKYGSKIYIANAELTGVDLRFFTNGYNLEYSCDSTDIPKGLEDVFGKERVKAWLDVDKDFQSELKRVFGTSRLPFGIADRLNNVICPTNDPTGDSYNNLSDKPRINGVALAGDKTAEQLDLVSNARFSEMKDKIENTLATANATMDFVQNTCVPKSSDRLLFEQDRKLLNDMQTALRTADDNSMVDLETLKRTLDRYPTKLGLEDILSAYVTSLDYNQKISEINGKLGNYELHMNEQDENIARCVTRDVWNRFEQNYAKTVNNIPVTSENNIVLDAGDIPVNAGDNVVQNSIKVALNNANNRIDTNESNITEMSASISAIKQQISDIKSGGITINRALRDGDGKLISSTYATNDNLDTRIERVSRLIADLTNRVSILEAKLS